MADHVPVCFRPMTPERAKFLRKQKARENKLTIAQAKNRKEKQRREQIESRERKVDMLTDREINADHKQKLAEHLNAIGMMESPYDRKQALAHPQLEEMIRKADRWAPDAKARARIKKRHEELRKAHALNEERKKLMAEKKAALKKLKIRL